MASALAGARLDFAVDAGFPATEIPLPQLARLAYSPGSKLIDDSPPRRDHGSRMSWVQRNFGLGVASWRYPPYELAHTVTANCAVSG
jgi:hypothetical protein